MVIPVEIALLALVFSSFIFGVVVGVVGLFVVVNRMVKEKKN